MSGPLLATAVTETDGTLSVLPVACPLAGKGPGGALLSCVTHDHWGQEHHCVYLAGLRHNGTVTLPLTMADIRRRMTERLSRSERCVVVCHEARPTVSPGA